MITITITDVTSEHPKDLEKLSAYLLEVASYYRKSENEFSDGTSRFMFPPKTTLDIKKDLPEMVAALKNDCERSEAERTDLDRRVRKMLFEMPGLTRAQALAEIKAGMNESTGRQPQFAKFELTEEKDSLEPADGAFATDSRNDESQWQRVTLDEAARTIAKNTMRDMQESGAIPFPLETPDQAFGNPDTRHWGTPRPQIPDQTFGSPVPVGNVTPVACTAGAVALPTAPVVNPVSLTGELDAEGLPWDARIHSRTKSLLANNKWREKRGVPDAEVQRVKVELRALYPVKHSNHVIRQVVGKDVTITENATVSGPIIPPPPATTPEVQNDAPFTELIDRIELLVKSGALAAQNIPVIIGAVPGAVNLSNLSKVWKKKPEVLIAAHAAVDAALRGA